MRAIRNSERISDPMVALRHDIAAIKRDMTSLVGDRVSAVGDAVAGRLNGVSEGARHLLTRAKKSAGAAHGQLSDVAGSRPLTTIAVSAAAGIVAAKVVGWMMRR